MLRSSNIINGNSAHVQINLARYLLGENEYNYVTKSRLVYDAKWNEFRRISKPWATNKLSFLYKLFCSAWQWPNQPREVQVDGRLKLINFRKFEAFTLPIELLLNYMHNHIIRRIIIIFFHITIFKFKWIRSF